MVNKSMLTYKGYTGQVEVDLDAEILHGKVLDIKDVITFEAKAIDEIKQAFQDSVDDYLEWCEELGEEPDKPFSGKLPFRTTSERHRAIYLAAARAGKSINSWMDEVLAKATSKTLVES